MICYKFMFIVLVIPFGHTIKVNMQGAVSLGKEISDTLVEYFQKNLVTGRRSLDNNSAFSTITVIVNSALLCRHLNFCQEHYENFLNNYITTQAESIETIFKKLIKKVREESNTVIFGEELKKVLKRIRRYLEDINNNITEDNAKSVWLELLKKISVTFKERAMVFGLDRLEGNVHEMQEVKKKLEQTLVIATTAVELQFERTLCSIHNVCQIKYDCSKSLYELLQMMNDISEDKIKQFIRIFNDALTQTGFYKIVSELTADEFRSILHDMANSNTIDTKNVFSILKDTVKRRIDTIKTNEDKSTGKDVKLVHIILSDLDFLHSKQKSNVFEHFLTDFNEWSKSGGNLSTEVRKVMKDLTKTMTIETEDISNKLINEVKVFMEITVDPEN